MQLCDPVAAPARNTEETPATSSTSVLSFLQKKKSATPMRTHLPSGDVEAYLADEDISLTDDPVKYWSGKLQCWPSLTRFALQHLSCPPTGVQSERVFSMAGNVVSPQRKITRSPLSDDKIGQSGPCSVCDMLAAYFS